MSLDKDNANSKTPPHLLAVFLSRDVLVYHYKTLTEAINNNQKISSLVGEGRTSVVTARKSGFTRQLLLGPLQASAYEYNSADWKLATEGFKHLPDRILDEKPSLVIAASFDISFVCSVAKTLYANSGQPISNDELTYIAEGASEFGLGDVLLFDRSQCTEDGEMWDCLYELSGE